MNLLLLIFSFDFVVASPKQPNIVFLLADDLGWGDVSWINDKMLTPNMEKLAKGGIRFDHAYSQQVCTPSRAALLSGMYPFHIGRQKQALKPQQPTGLSLKLKTFPEEMKKLGYTTHMVGKWHLGGQLFSSIIHAIFFQDFAHGSLRRQEEGLTPF